jgi:hypothetical protein
VSSLKVGSLSAITVNTGALNVSGQLAVGSGGSITGNSAGFESGAGFYLDSQNFSIGQSGAYMSYSTASGTLKIGNITMTGLLYSPGKSNYSSGDGIMLGRYAADGFGYFGVTSTASGSLKGIWVTSSDGIVHMTGADVSGGTVTGTVVQTASSGQRIVLNEGSTNTLRVYSDLGFGGGVEKVCELGPINGSSSAICGSFGKSSAFNASYGVQGLSGTGIGVTGYSPSGSGVYGSTDTGVGVYAIALSGGDALYASGRVRITGAFGCNGATPQGPKVSGGTLSGVIAALVANGILSS